MDPERLEAGVRAGERRALARLISLVERDDPEARLVLDRLHDRFGRAHVVGITGSPGTGKSTITDRLIDHYRRQELSVGVVAVDPSSPFTGGAILGDRIRMQTRSGDPELFIRSMGSRGALGGLSTHTYGAIQALDAAGKDVVLVETVGVGQAEVDVVRIADTVVVVLVPNLGDDVQAVKAGIMEVADVFAVNKSDIAGADKVEAEVEAAMGLAHPPEAAWTPPILRLAAEKGQGIEELAAAITRHRAWAEETGAWQRRRDQRFRDQMRRVLERDVVAFAFDRHGELRAPFLPLLDEARRGHRSPHDVAHEILAQYKEE